MSEMHKWGVFDFSLEVNEETNRCSECGRQIPKGEQMWVNRAPRNGRYLRKGMVGKRVCSVECGQTFDYRMMRERVRRRSAGEL